MKRLRSLLSLLLIMSMLAGIIPFASLVPTAHAEEGTGNYTSGATKVDLDALMAIIDDDTDSNSDGLPDELCRILGLDPDLEDSNGDGLSDKFKLDNGLDPLSADTYDIGITDLYALTKGDTDLPLSSGLLDVDTDGDGTPDIQDTDIDGDNVPNASDLSPFSSMSASDSQTITLETDGNSVNVKLQVQPADMESLKENSRIMTWPIDTEGQMNNIDDSEDNVKIVPMLEVDLPEALSDDIISEWGYVYFNDQLFLPLQYVEDDYEPVALSAELYLPENYGEDIHFDGGETSMTAYQIEVTFRLSWLMVAQTHDLSAEWEPFAKIQMEETESRPVYAYDATGTLMTGIDHWEEYTYLDDVELEDFDVTYYNEILGSSVADRNDNDIPDVTVFWYSGDREQVMQTIYYDLSYDSDAGVYIAASQEVKSVPQCDYIDDNQAHIEATSDELYRTRVNNAKYAIDLVQHATDASTNTAYYTAYDGYLEVTPNFHYTGFSAEPFTIEGAGYYTETGNRIYSEFASILNEWPWNPQQYSYIRDTAFLQVPTDSSTRSKGEIWFLYETYNSGLDCNQIVLVLEDNSTGENVVTSQVLLSGLEPDPDTQAGRFFLGDLDKALSLDIHDVDKDGVEDLMFTTRDGRMFYINDFRADTNWTDRMYELPDGRDTEGIFSQSTQYYDFNNDGTEELVSIQAVRSSDYYSTDLTFQISTKEDITTTSKVLMKDTDAFSITGLQADEHEGLDTTVLAGDHTEDLVYMASLLQQYYLQGDRSMQDTVDTYISEVLDGDDSWLDRSTGSYAHLYEALLDIGKQISENETWKAYDGPQPLLILTLGKENLINLDDTDDTDRRGNTLRLAIPSDETVVNKQLILKWHDDGATLSADDITDMVNSNDAWSDSGGLYEFEEDPDGAAEVLAALNTGLSEIIGIGDDITKAESLNALKEVMTEWKSLIIPKNVVTKIPTLSKTFYGQLYRLGITKFIKPSLRKIPYATGTAYKTEVAKYNKMLGSYSKYGKAINCVGYLVDVGVSVYSGYLYGKNMAEAGGTAYGVVTGITYGCIVCATSILTTYLVSIGPVGWVLAAAIVGDSLLAGMINGYSGTVTMGITAIMDALYSTNTYPGTQLMSIENTENCKTETTGMDYGVVVSSKFRQVLEQEALIRASSKSSPANDYDSLDESHAYIFISYSGSDIKINAEESHTSTVYKDDGFWYNRWVNNNDDTIEFLKAGINIPVVRTTRLDTRLIGSVRVNRYAFYTDTNENMTNTTYIDKETNYYDVLPQSLAEFWQTFVPNNGLTYKDPYLDSDGDGVPDDSEEELGLDKTKTDTDRDGMTDFDELKYGLDPLSKDTDDDGLYDSTEANNRYKITITTSLGSVNAWILSDPTKADTDGDGQSDLKERTDQTNAASCCTNGSPLFDGNDNAPALLKAFEDKNVLDGTKLSFDLSEYFSDEDGDTLVYDADYGEISDDGVLTYTFDPANDGAVVEITVSASDQKGGVCEDSFQVYDTTCPVIESIQATYPDDGSLASVTPLVLTEFEDELYTNPTFVVSFNKPINFDGIDTAAITIAPTENADLDCDWDLEQHSTAVTVEQVEGDSSAIKITRTEPIVENAITYELSIPAEAIKDNSDNQLEQGLTSTFYTGDHVYPWIVSVSDYADLDTPLVLTFSEDVVLTDDQRIDLFGANEIVSYETPVGVQTGSRTIEVAIRENFYTSGEQYRFGDSFDYVKNMSGGQSITAPSAYYDNITDTHGNKLYTEAVLSDEDRTFTVGEVSGSKKVTGPEINETLHSFSDSDLNSLSENWYEVTAEDNGEIRIKWTSDIYEGEDFDGIFLLHGDAASYWFNSNVDRDELKTLAVEPEACRIEGNTLIITPPDYLITLGVSIDVLIPSTALVDANGLSIYDSRRSKEMWNQSVRVPNTKPFYISVVASTDASSEQQAERVVTLADRSYTGMILALCSLPEQAAQIVDPGNTLTVLATQTISAVTADGITLYKVQDDGSEVLTDYQTPYALTTDENPNPTRAFTIDLNEPMLAGETYVLKIAEGAIGSNSAQELAFIVGDQPTDYCGVNNLTAQSVTGLIKVGEEVSASSGFQKYYDQIEGTLSYQWYAGDTDNPDAAQAISGATDQTYVPQSTDEGNYLFLELTADTTAEDSKIENPFVCWGSTTSTYMTQALGVVEAAFLTDTDLIKLSVMESGDEATELLTDFDSATTEYSLDLDFGTESVRVNALAGTESNATVYINGSSSEDWTETDGLDILLYPGINKITVKVVAENTRQSKEYTLTITRGGVSDADTSQLKPLAKQVGVRNDMELYTGQTLYGEYVFYDYLGRAESGTTYQWYRSSDKAGTDKTAITGADGRTYTLTSEDAGKYIFFEVTPQADGSVSGNAVRSLGIGSVTATDALTSDITDIEVLYGDSDLLGSYSSDQKVYPITYVLQDSTTQAQITVTGGSNVSINGTAGNTATIDLLETCVIEITADVSGADGQTSYYVLLDSRSQPAAVVIEGDEAVTVDGSADVTVEWQGITYDQYSDVMETTLNWTVPSGLGKSESGLYRQYLTMTVPASGSSGTYDILADAAFYSDITAKKSLVVTSTATGGGGSDTPSTPGTSSDSASASTTNDENEESSLAIEVDTTEGTATVDGSGLSGGFTKHPVITVPEIDGVSAYKLTLPLSPLTEQQEGSLLFRTEQGSITIPDNMLSYVSGASGVTAGIAIGAVDESTLPDAVNASVGHRPVVQLSLTVDGQTVEWNNPDAPVTVSVPYTPTAAELKHPEHIVVWYIDGSGKVVAVPNGHYDTETGTVIFKATHFSCYAIAYVEKTFSDLDGYAWAGKSIEILASKGIINGTGADNFSPAADITRADYLVLLIRTLGLTADFTDNFDDITQDDYYYEACGIAKALGISTGSGNNLFNPQERISRQDMMVLTARALENYKGLEAAESTAVLDQFTDRADIADYAAQNLATLVSEGLIQGSNNRLTPTANSTRAEAAVFLYRIYEKFTLA